MNRRFSQKIRSRWLLLAFSLLAACTVPLGTSKLEAQTASQQDWTGVNFRGDTISIEQHFSSQLQGGIPVYGTTTRSRLHVSYQGPEGLQLYSEIRGTILAGDSRSNLAVSFLEAPDGSQYYALRSAGNRGFSLIAEGSSLAGAHKSGITAHPGVLYAFAILLSDVDGGIRIQARVWPAADIEPDDFSMDCVDISASQLTQGTVGFLTHGPSTKAIGSLSLDGISLPLPGDDSGVSLDPTDDGDDVVNEAVVESIDLAIPDSVLFLGESTTLQVTATLDDGSLLDVTADAQVTIDPPSVLLTDPGDPAALFADALGVAQVIAQLGSLTTNTATIQVVAPPPTLLSLELTGTTEIAVGYLGNLSVAATFDDGSESDVSGDVSWLVSDPSVLELASGAQAMFVSLQEGACDLVATLDGVSSNTLTVVVSNGVVDPPSNDTPDGSFVAWMDTAAGNSMSEDDSLFDVFAVSGEQVLGTTSSLTNIHSHFQGVGSASFGNYEFTGRMRYDSGDGSMGITFLSDYPNSDNYYRIRRYNGGSFHMAPHPHGINLSGTVNSGVNPAPNTWYLFRVVVADEGSQTRIQARIWADGSSEPSNWQIDCLDTRSARLTTGTVGCWAMGDGGRFWSDLRLNGQPLFDEQPSVLVAAVGTTSLSPGATTTLAAQLVHPGSTTEDVSDQVTWSADPPGVVAIEGNPPQITALSIGSATITCTLDDLSADPLSVSVFDIELSGIELTASAGVLALGSSLDLNLTAIYSDGSQQDVTSAATFHVADPAVASLAPGAAGVVVAVGPGSTSLHATWEGQTSDFINLTVVEPGGEGVLVPGNGFSGTTPQPGTVGSGSGSNARAIARFDVVPFQTFQGDFSIGVVAFHINGIDRVEMSVDGGPWLPIQDMTVNPRTGVGEYWATLRAIDCGTGAVEVRAVAYPVVGQPRVLPPLFLFADAGGLDNQVRYIGPNGSDSSGNGTASSPFRTARKAARDIQLSSSDGTADGGIIYCLAGNIILEDGGSPATTQDRYVTIMPAPGLTHEDVQITSSGKNVETRLLRIYGMKIRSSIKSGFSNDEISSGEEEAYVWFDNCVFQGNGATTTISSLTFVAHTRFTAYFATDTVLRDDKNGLTYSTLLRNVHCQNLGSDAYKNSRMLVNCSVDNINSGSTGWHADVVQFTRSQQNTILYGLRATNVKAQGIFSKPSTLNLEDTAMVNVLIEEVATLKSEWEANSGHFLLWNSSFIDHPFYYTGNGANVSIRNNFFDKFGAAPSGSDVDNNHYRDANGSSPGSNATVGGSTASLFLNAAADDFRPASGSNLRGPNRPDPVTDPLIPLDATGSPWGLPASIGALEN